MSRCKLKKEDVYLVNFDMEKLLQDEQAKQAIEEMVHAAVEQAKSEWELGANERIAAARLEGQRIAGLSAEEQLAQRERELEKREIEIRKRELRAMAAQQLAARGLPSELAEAINYDDREACERSIDDVERVFRDAVQRGVTMRLGAAAPKAAPVGLDAAKLTDEQYYSARMGMN